VNRLAGALLLAAALAAAILAVTSAMRDRPRETASVSPAFADGDPALECLSLNVYWEARSEPPLGQLAVAAVTLNRVDHPAFPDDVCSVVFDGGEWPRHRCQFSWWCDGKSNRPRDMAAWETARAAAEKVLSRRYNDPTNGALWYHADYVRPPWADTLAPVTRIGRHVYYRKS